jgi:ribosome-associated toxin RatA of RatAB toxin-antitoxin module
MSRDSTQGGDASTIEVRFAADGLPSGAAAERVAAATPAQVWAVIDDLERYPERVPMISKARRVTPRAPGAPLGPRERIEMQLKFRIALFSAKFGFVGDVTGEPERWLELDWVSGEPGSLHIRFDLEPVDDGRATRVRAAVSFDIRTLGWLVKFFLRHHPEIQYGVFPGSALVLVDSLCRVAEGRPPPGK